MKILIIYPKFYVYGGGEKLVVRLCNYLSDNGVENAVLTTSMMPEVRRDLKATDVLIAENRHCTAVGEVMALCRGVRKHGGQYDVLNPHNYPAEAAALFSSKPAVWMCNEPELHLYLKYGSFHYKYRLFLRVMVPFEKLAVRRMARSVVADRFNAERFKDIYGCIPAIINYGIDVDYFSVGDRGAARQELGLGNDFVLLHVGMATPFKNQMASLKTFNVLSRTIPEIRLVIAGSWQENYKRELDAFIKSTGLGDRVTFTGHVCSDTLRQWYYASDALLHPIKSQGGWLSPFEALCAGTPIIVSSEMTASDVIKKQGMGVVSDDYVSAVLDIYKNRDAHRERAQRGAAWARHNLSWGSFGKGMLDEFYKAVGDRFSACGSVKRESFRGAAA